MNNSRNRQWVIDLEWLLLLCLIAVVVLAGISIVTDDRPIFDKMPAVTSTTSP